MESNAPLKDNNMLASENKIINAGSMIENKNATTNESNSLTSLEAFNIDNNSFNETKADKDENNNLNKEQVDQRPEHSSKICSIDPCIQESERVTENNIIPPKSEGENIQPTMIDKHIVPDPLINNMCLENKSVTNPEENKNKISTSLSDSSQTCQSLDSQVSQSLGSQVSQSLSSQVSQSSSDNNHGEHVMPITDNKCIVSETDGKNTMSETNGNKFLTSLILDHKALQDIIPHSENKDTIQLPAIQLPTTSEDKYPTQILLSDPHLENKDTINSTISKLHSKHTSLDSKHTTQAKEEILNHLKSVTQNWHKKDIHKLSYLTATGEPPSNITTEEWGEIKERGYKFWKISA